MTCRQAVELTRLRRCSARGQREEKVDKGPARFEKRKDPKQDEGPSPWERARYNSTIRKLL